MTNETLEVLKNRRSIRKYRPEQIKPEELDAILEVGTYAPTGMGKQSPVMVVVQDAETLRTLSQINAELFGKPGFDPFYGAPALLIVLSDRQYSTYLYDGSLVMGNMMNAAHALGLGSCWIHRAREEFDSPEGKELLRTLGIKGDYEGIGNLIVGYPDGEIPEAKPRREGRVFYAK